jgi:hypothetical protein
MPNTPEYFDYQSVAREPGIAEADLAAIEDIARKDYPGDQMMFELRMLRTCRAIKEGQATVADALRGEDDNPSASSAA